jgi:hypothetical protein
MADGYGRPSSTSYGQRGQDERGRGTPTVEVETASWAVGRDPLTIGYANVAKGGAGIRGPDGRQIWIKAKDLRRRGCR